jgi:hypothetical protein
MKFISIFFALMLPMFFMGCGGGDASGNGPGAARDIKVATDNATLMPQNKAVVQMTFSSPSQDENVKIEISNMSLTVSGCSIDTTTFTPEKLTLMPGVSATTMANITFTSECSSLQSLSISYTKVTSSLTSNSSISEKESVAVGSRAVGGTFFLSPQQLSIFNNNRNETIKIVTLNESNQPVSTSVALSSLTDGSGKDFGSFDTYNVITDAKGEASVTYTAPSNINKVNGISKKVVFERADNNSSNTLVIVFSPSENNQGSIYTVKIEQDEKITVNDSGTFTVNFIQADNNQSFLSDAQILDVNVTSITPDKALLIDENGNKVATINYKAANKKAILVKAGTIAGSAFFNIDALIFDGAKKAKISLAGTITISSGAVSKMSIVYANTKFKDDEGTNGIFYETYTIHVVDRFNNPPNKKVSIYAGVVGGLSKSSHQNDFEFYLPQSVDIKNTSNLIEMTKSSSNPINFNPGGINGQLGVKPTDTVVFLANSNGAHTDFLGGWHIENIEEYKLDLRGLYYGGDYKKLTAVIGDSSRLDARCSQTLYEIDMDAQNGIYTTDENGIATFTLKYDPYFVAKDVYLYAHTYLNNDNGTARRVGTGSRKKLRGEGFNVDNDTIKCDVNTTKIATMTFTTGDGNIPLVDVKPSFSYTGGAGCNITILNFEQKTGCSGTIQFRLSNYPGTMSGGNGSEEQECSVSWNGAIFYEHDSGER